MIEDKYCIGCGVKLQDSNMLYDGYTPDLSNDICSRCFKLRNYGDYQITTKSNEEYIDILKSVNETKDLVLYIVDLLNIEKDIKMIRNYITNRLILVLTKRDVLPRSVNDDKIKEYFKNLGLDYQDIIIISSNKNYNMDELLLMIKKHKSSKNVYVVGHTNVGKSTLINKMVQNYGDEKYELTISPLPSTTLNKIVMKLTDDLTLIDTPGLIDRGNIANYLDFDTIKKVNPKKEIDPYTFQMREGQSVIVDNLFRIDYLEGDKNSFTFFMSNDLEKDKKDTSRCEVLNDLNKMTIEVGYHQDLVINGLGFIKITEKALVDVYVESNTEVFVRDSLI
ncbi:MAG: ribosome biogenesis GTPase YqeH [Bacilli bacterium]|nr:ribosome biogenesis GTPase YqeH [Bacilli bacterium]